MPKTIRNYLPSQPDLLNPLEPVDYRAELRDWMLGLIGLTDPDPLFRAAAPCYPDGAASGRAWCGITILAGLRAVGLTDWLWVDGRGFLYRLGWDQQTRKPQVGDICYLDKPHQHHCLVVSVDLEAGTCETVGGNEGSPGRVGEPVPRKLNEKRLTFFKIDKLVDAAIARDRTPAEPPV
jgi:hypothetical protein